jgi:hypothetical protein
MNDMLTPEISEEEAAALLRSFRADRMLAKAAEVIVHVRAKATSGDQERGETLNEWSAPMRITSADAADEVYVQLLNWVSFWSAELQVAPPSSAIAAWSNMREAQGFRAGTSPEGAAALVTMQTMWLRLRREEIRAHASGPVYEDDVIRFLGELEGANPLEQRDPRPAYARPCPVCDVFAVRAEWFGPDIRDVAVECSHCGHVIGADSYRAVLSWLPERSR